MHYDLTQTYIKVWQVFKQGFVETKVHLFHFHLLYPYSGAFPLCFKPLILVATT